MRNAVLFPAIALILLFAAISGFSLNSYAAESKLVSLDQSKDITIIVGYDTEKPKVVFISPDGKRYEKTEDFDQVADSEKSTYYNIASAQSGDWKIEYEKGKNKEITVDVVPWHKPITANSLSFETASSDGYDLPFIQGKINAAYGDRNYNYILSAAVKDADGNIVNMIEIGNGSGRSGEDSEFSVYPDVLPDGEYYLIAEVYAEDETGTEVHDSIEASGTFTITGNTIAGAPECLKVLCNITDGFIDISFDASGEEFDCDEYSLVVAQEKKDDYLAVQTYNEEIFADHVLFDPADGNITIQINAKAGKSKYLTWSRTVIPAMPISASIDTPEITNELNAVISFDAGEETYYGRLIIGDVSKELQLSGSNKIQVGLEPMEVNELELQIDSDNVTYSINGRVAVDNTPPVIDIYGASGNMTTKDNNVVFVGSTDAGATLICNGENVALGEDGSFTITEELTADETDFKFESVDAAGNSTVRNIHITRSTKTAAKDKTENSGIKILLLTVLGAAFFALVLGIIAGLASSRCKRKGIDRKPFGAIFVAFMSMLSAVFTGFGIWQICFHFKKKDEISGENLINLISSVTTSDIASIIKEEKAYLYNSFISFGIALICIIVVVIYAVVRSKLSKRKKGKNKKAST
jgi:hypothetical protein